jgi:hypothetical protein
MKMLEKLAAGREIPKLLFVTNFEKLKQKIGGWCFQRIKTMLGNQLINLEIKTAKKHINWTDYRNTIIGSKAQGIVILGGYSVMPAQKHDVLVNGQREAEFLDSSGKTILLGDMDTEEFFVWCDDCYGCLDDATFPFPDLPVSRIPDCDSGEFILTALCANSPKNPLKSGIRNLDRNYAQIIFDQFQSNSYFGELITSPESQYNCFDFNSQYAQLFVNNKLYADYLYLQLHGARCDGKQQWGEKNIVAITNVNVPSYSQQLGRIIFSGSCWASRIIDEYPHKPIQSLTSRTSQNLIALRFLEEGALAFIGCTGEHISPGGDFNRSFGFGVPMHWYFWKYIQLGLQPAPALHAAKIRFAKLMSDHPQQFVSNAALEQKILWQYNCLGLGW